MSRRLKHIVLGLVGLAGLTAIVLAILAALIKLPGEEKTPARVRRDMVLYITMREGAQTAADVWLPQDITPPAQGGSGRLSLQLG